MNAARLIYMIRQTAYTIFAFCYFLFAAASLTIRGFLLLYLGSKTEENKRTFHKILQREARFVVNHIPGTTFRYANDAGETFSTPSIIICNHQSHLDLMAIMMLTPNLIILTKNWVWHNPFYGLLIRFADYLPVTDDEKMMEKIRDRVARGYSVMVFPEGTRSADCRIQRFHRGAFKMAEDLQLDITPVFISGFGKVLPKTSWHLHNGHLAMEVWPRLCRKEEVWTHGGYREVTRIMHRLYKDRNEEVRNNR